MTTLRSQYLPQNLHRAYSHRVDVRTTQSHSFVKWCSDCCTHTRVEMLAILLKYGAVKWPCTLGERACSWYRITAYDCISFHSHWICELKLFEASKSLLWKDSDIEPRMIGQLRCPILRDICSVSSSRETISCLVDLVCMRNKLPRELLPTYLACPHESKYNYGVDEFLAEY